MPRKVRGTTDTDTTTTHEEYLARVRTLAIRHATTTGTITEAEAETLSRARMVYGLGTGRDRGITVYQAWQNGTTDPVSLVEIAATAEESWIQLTGTTIHELGHVLAGWTAGHGPEWKNAAERLGLRHPMAAGQKYLLSQLEPTVRIGAHAAAQSLADGNPQFKMALGVQAVQLPTAPRPCSQGIGTRGGTSRGAGSGSRMRKYVCSCSEHDGKPGPWIVRAATDNLSAHCDICDSAFTRAEGK